MHILLDISKLKARAEDSGITLAELCARANISVSQPSRLGRAKRGGTVATLVRLNLALFDLERRRRDYFRDLDIPGEDAA